MQSCSVLPILIAHQAHTTDSKLLRVMHYKNYSLTYSISIQSHLYIKQLLVAAAVDAVQMVVMLYL